MTTQKTLTITKPLYPAWIEQTSMTTPVILQTVCVSDDVAQQLADFFHWDMWEVMDYVDKEKPVAFSQADISSYLYGDGGVCVHINAILEYPMFDLEVREELPAMDMCKEAVRLLSEPDRRVLAEKGNFLARM